MNRTKVDILTDTLRANGTLRTKEIAALGVSKAYLSKLHTAGIVKRFGRGVYGLPDREPTASDSFAEAARRVPKGVICLLSALRFHNLTTQAPFEVWMAIDVKAKAPKPSGVPLRIVRFSGEALTSGIEKHDVSGVKVKVYSVAKTIADCFKYRNKIGLDVAMEALREGWREKAFTMDDLWSYAKICRVSRVMQPYLEALTAS